MNEKCVFFSLGFRWIICLDRQLYPHIWQVFMPTTFMVCLSWASFLIPPSCFPGRMGLLVTIVLCIINVMTSMMQQSPESNGLNAMNCWFLICLILVALASLEYAILLFFMRFPDTQIHMDRSRTTNTPPKNVKLEAKSYLSRYDGSHIDFCSILIFPPLFLIIAITYFVGYLLLKSSAC